METLDQSGIDHEINFWKTFVKTDRFLKDWCSNDKTNELNQVVYEFLKSLPDNIVVLDVGSGPVSLLRGTVKNITTVDPLAEMYKQIFDFKSAGITPPLNYPCEDLPELHNSQFDVVHISNAIDHTVDPFKAFERLWDCVKPGGYLIVQGHENEAEHEKWQGFHQWNIKLVDEGLFIEGKHDIGTLTHEGKSIILHRETLNTGRNWYIWAIQK